MHVVGTFGLGGAEHFLIRLTAALAESGHPTVAVVRPESPVADAVPSGVERIELPLRKGLDFRTPRALRRLVEERRPAAIQTYMGRATRMTRLKPGSGTLHVARLGGPYPLRDFRHADVWVGNTRGLCDWMRGAGLPAERVHRIGNFSDPVDPFSPERRRAVRQEFGADEDTFLIASLGRFAPKKGFMDLVDAVARLPDRVGGQTPRLVLAGEGGERAALEAAAKAIPDRVLLVPWSDRPADVLRAADLCVVPSRQETLGNVVLEAWACGVPVVATAAAGPAELINDEVDGLLCPVSDPPALARRIEDAWRAGPEARAAWAAAGRVVLDSRHSRAAVVDAYLALYRDADRWIRR